MVIKKYEKKFVEMYKEAEKLHGVEAEKLSEKEWKKRCDKLFRSAEKTKKQIDEDVKKLSEVKGIFRRIDPRTDCGMIAYYIKDDCNTWPDRCPVEIKKIVVEELRDDLKWTEIPERIKKIEEQIKNLEK